MFILFITANLYLTRLLIMIKIYVFYDLKCDNSFMQYSKTIINSKTCIRLDSELLPLYKHMLYDAIYL